MGWNLKFVGVGTPNSSQMKSSAQHGRSSLSATPIYVGLDELAIESTGAHWGGKIFDRSQRVGMGSHDGHGGGK